MCFVRKGLDRVFDQRELKWLDDIMPEAHKRAKEDEIIKQEEVSSHVSQTFTIVVVWTFCSLAGMKKFKDEEIGTRVLGAVVQGFAFRIQIASLTHSWGLLLSQCESFDHLAELHPLHGLRVLLRLPDHTAGATGPRNREHPAIVLQ